MLNSSIKCIDNFINEYRKYQGVFVPYNLNNSHWVFAATKMDE
jgi:predicted DNA-binding protein (MmcQ/YjbR family)